MCGWKLVFVAVLYQVLRRCSTMKDQSSSEEVMRILEEAPNAQKALRENYNNLQSVAEYCYDNYVMSGDSSLKALEETKNFTTQSLASVAYQISSLANQMLSLLNAQTNQLLHMESSINLVGQMVEMHKEKVSRREIGVFTSVRRISRNHKIVPPSGSKSLPPYSRRPINYQQLDAVGHGVKVPAGKQADKTGIIRRQGTSTRNNKPEPVLCPVAPPAVSSSFGKPVAPPTIASSECDIVTTQLPEAPPPPPPPPTIEDDNNVDSPGEGEAPPPPPTAESLTNHSAPAEDSLVSMPLPLETDDDIFPQLTNDGPEILTQPPPPPPNQDKDALSPSARSLSLRARSGPSSRHRYTYSLFLPAVQSLMIPPPPSYPPPSVPPPSPRLCLLARLQHLDLEIPAPPPPPPILLDAEKELDDMTDPLPPPLDDDSHAPTQCLDEGGMF
ncbi:ABI family, member 3a isoform X2 [Gouania willdenowi]|uniref:ABI family, member 3a isoform X2 n=1 Tax=Gouania willdenowi TaxID=441366 RepID=UPI0010568A5D|nr:ABI gene family member 3-like isoform X2 [Gouania willdenowi]